MNEEHMIYQNHFHQLINKVIYSVQQKEEIVNKEEIDVIMVVELKIVKN